MSRAAVASCEDVRSEKREEKVATMPKSAMANKAVLAAVMAAIVAVLALVVVGLGSCSPSNEGGPAAPAAGGGPAEAGYDADTGLSDTDDDGGYDYAPSTSADAAPDVTLDEYRAMLEKDAAPTGANARDASKSKNVPTASKVYAQLSERGFSDIEVMADYDTDGVYHDTVVLDPSSEKRYPCYTAAYLSKNNITWTIYINEGSYYAVPLNTSSRALSKDIIVSESDVLVQYDGLKNEFSEFAFDKAEGMTCVKVARIDKATLDSYSADDLENL